jgi:hypothetical protein
MATFSMLHVTKFTGEDFGIDRSVPPENVLLDTTHIAATLKLHFLPLKSIK